MHVLLSVSCPRHAAQPLFKLCMARNSLQSMCYLRLRDRIAASIVPVCNGVHQHDCSSFSYWTDDGSPAHQISKKPRSDCRHYSNASHAQAAHHFNYLFLEVQACGSHASPNRALERRIPCPARFLLPSESACCASHRNARGSCMCQFGPWIRITDFISSTERATATKATFSIEPCGLLMASAALSVHACSRCQNYAHLQVLPAPGCLKTACCTAFSGIDAASRWKRGFDENEICL